MTTDPDHITMTGPETAALAPVLADLYPADVQRILDQGRRCGLADQSSRRRGSADPLFVCARTPDLINGWRRAMAEYGEMAFRFCVPQNRGLVGGTMTDEEYTAAATAYGETFLAAAEAMNALYLDDPAVADAALAALDAMGAGDAR